MTAPAMSNAIAAQIIRQEWQNVWGRPPTDNEVLFTQAVAKLETGYGRIGQFAKLAEQGLFNWANIEMARKGETCPPGWAPGVDSAQNVCFRVYPSDNEAARALIQNLTKRHWPTVDAMAQGTPEAVAHAMKASPAYYSAPESEYAKAIRNAINAIGQSPSTASAAPSGVAATSTKSRVAASGLIATGAVGFAFGLWKLFKGR